MSNSDIPSGDLPDGSGPTPRAGSPGSSSTGASRQSPRPSGPPPGAHRPGADQQTRPWPPRRIAAGLFDSIRRSGMMRTDQRWIGGVAGGLSRRLGVDVTLVRCVWIVLSLFFGPGLVLYGLAWALLPEESDGRIHAEQALVGDVSAGLVGSVIVFIGGLNQGLFPSWYMDHWYDLGIIAVFWHLCWALVWIGLIAGVIIWFVRSLRGRSGRRPRPDPDRPAWFHQADPSPEPTPGAPAGPGHGRTAFAPESTGESSPSDPAPGRAAPASAPSSPHGVPVAPRRPVYGPRPVPPRPRVPGPGRTASLLVLGLCLIGLAAAGLAHTTHTLSTFQAIFLTAGGVILLLASGIIVSALRGRRGGWMTGLGWLSLLAGLPLLVFGSILPPQAVSAPIAGRPVDIVLTDADLDPATTSYPVLPDGTIDLGAYAAGSVTVDLRRVAWDADGDKDAAVRIVMGAGRVLVKTGEGQPVRVDGHAEAGEFGTEFTSAWETNFPADDEQWPAKTYTVQGEELPLSHTWWPLNHSRSEAVSPAAKDRHGLISVDAEVGAGAIKAEETSSQVSWTGSTQAGTWVVSSWTDPSSGHHSGDELPVTGMTHPAVGTDVAESCLSRVMGDDEPRRARWSDVSDLSEATRSAYEGCLTSAWERGEGSGTAAPEPSGSASNSGPGATGTAAPSSTPTH